MTTNERRERMADLVLMAIEQRIDGNKEQEEAYLERLYYHKMAILRETGKLNEFMVECGWRW